MKHLLKQPLFYTTVISLLALGLIIASYVFGWTTPTASPPAGNVVLSQGALPAGSAGYVQFASSSTAFGADANFFWDNTNKRLGIGTTSPQNALDVVGNISVNTGSVVLEPSGTPTAQKGALYYDQSTDTFKGYQGSQWVNIFTNVYSPAGYTVSTVNGATSATTAKSAADTILVSPIYIPFTMSVNSFLLQVTTALGATGDVGLYNSDGTLVLNGGSGTLTTTTGLKSVATQQSNKTITPGQYYVAVTWNSTTGVIAGVNIGVAGLIPRSGTITGGGSVLPSSLTLSNITNTTYIYAVTLSGSTQKENGALCQSASDCFSGICYADEDGDRYVPTSGTKRCKSVASLSGTDCNDSCSTCYPGSTAYTTSPDGLDQNCDGTVDNITGVVSCTPSFGTITYFGYNSSCVWGAGNSYKYTSVSNNAPADKTHCTISGTTCTSYVGGWGSCTEYADANTSRTGSLQCGSTYWGDGEIIGGTSLTTYWYQCAPMTGCSAIYKYQ